MTLTLSSSTGRTAAIEPVLNVGAGVLGLPSSGLSKALFAVKRVPGCDDVAVVEVLDSSTEVAVETRVSADAAWELVEHLTVGEHATLTTHVTTRVVLTAPAVPGLSLPLFFKVGTVRGPLGVREEADCGESSSRLNTAADVPTQTAAGSAHQACVDLVSSSEEGASPPTKRHRHSGAGTQSPDKQAYGLAPFGLLWLQHPVARPYNHGAYGVKLRQLICGRPHLVLVSNFMIDFPWLLSACPALAHATRLVVVHGLVESAADLSREVRELTQSWGTAKVTVHRPPLPIPYGTHHSKFFLAFYDTGVRIVVHTANLIFCDCNNKTQGVWVQDFPRKAGPPTPSSSTAAATDFEATLLGYLTSLRLPQAAHEDVMTAVRAFDYSSARAMLLPSTPGYHRGDAVAQQGHMRLRALLRGGCLPARFWGANVCAQFSSLGSLTDRWMREFEASCASGSVPQRGVPRSQALVVLPTQMSHLYFLQTPSGSASCVTANRTADCQRGAGCSLQLVWPRVEDVRSSYEGWAAGRSVPGRAANVHKPFVHSRLHRWDATACQRQRACPHIKTYCRYAGDELAWVVVASHNLSRAAWGELQKGGAQLFVRSYELGVLMLPALEAAYREHCHYGFSVTDAPGCSLAALMSCPTVRRRALGSASAVDSSDGSGCKVRFRVVGRSDDVGNGAELRDADVPVPLPHALPPAQYSEVDEAWTADVAHAGHDVNGETIMASGSSMYGLSQLLVPSYFERDS